MCFVACDSALHDSAGPIIHSSGAPQTPLLSPLCPQVWEVPIASAQFGGGLPAIPGAPAGVKPGSLVFDLRVESFNTSPAVDRSIDDFATIVPPLSVPGGARQGQFNVRRGASRKALDSSDGTPHSGKSVVKVGGRKVALDSDGVVPKVAH